MGDPIKEWTNGNLSPPSSIQFHPTLKCNLHCYFCNNAAEIDNSNELSDKKLLSIIDEASIMGVKYVIISGGGEPLVRKKLILEMMKRAKNYDMDGCVMTNGTLINSNDARNLVKIQWGRIIFSVHGSYLMLDDLIRGGRNAFRRTIKTIRKINFWKKKFKFSEPILGFRIVVTKDNYHDVDNMIKLTKDLMIDQLYIKMVDENPHLLITQKQFPVFVSKIHNTITYAKKEKIDLILELSLKHIKYQLFGEPKIINKGSTTCKVPFTKIVIFANGKTSQCCNFWDKKSVFVDDISHKSLKEIWDGNKFESFRKSLVNNQIPEICKRCSYYG